VAKDKVTSSTVLDTEHGWMAGMAVVIVTVLMLLASVTAGAVDVGREPTGGDRPTAAWSNTPSVH
jgi:hypothetical protein